MATQKGRSPPGHFLFRSSPLIEESTFLLEHLRSALEDRGDNPHVLDIGCGSGRDAIIMASKGWQVTALDRDEKGVKRCGALAARQGCNDLFRGVCVELKKSGDLLDVLRREGHSDRQYDAVIVNRTLHRETLPEIASLLRPGGLLLYHTFTEGNSHPTDPKSVLGVSELRDTFSPTLDILRDEILPVEDGRLLTFFVARYALLMMRTPSNMNLAGSVQDLKEVSTINSNPPKNGPGATGVTSRSCQGCVEFGMGIPGLTLGMF